MGMYKLYTEKKSLVGSKDVPFAKKILKYSNVFSFTPIEIHYLLGWEQGISRELPKF
jgi:hypothetical protein